jgi:hypothetical protein
MRMWGIDPIYLCQQHLLGEHFEMHCFLGALRKGTKLEGFKSGMLDLYRLKTRHDALAVELLKRGLAHNSPMEEPNLEGVSSLGFVDVAKAWDTLHNRCTKCRERMRTDVDCLQEVSLRRRT